MREVGWSLAELLALASIVAGVALMSVPIALIVAGALVIAASVVRNGVGR